MVSVRNSVAVLDKFGKILIFCHLYAKIANNFRSTSSTFEETFVDSITLLPDYDVNIRVERFGSSFIFGDRMIS